ncbi:MAG: hypothetical protein RMJ37_02505 [Spirochaetia bacterium]|nr:hypothetical protein [Spirochaetota bacterium]MCX8096080.1 hypothetical protein [Spirochaetota bacterium]MDW8112198.1 hypothetical protein [Spirochaetia bacterium]
MKHSLILILGLLILKMTGFSIETDLKTSKTTSIQKSQQPTNVSSTNTNEVSIQELLAILEKNQFKTNISIYETNVLQKVEFNQMKSLKATFEFEPKEDIKEKPFFLSYERRYEIILLVSIPTTYMVAKYLMEQVSFYNYRDNNRNLNTQQWAYIIASSIIVPFIIATEDHIQYKKFVEEKLKY